MKLLYYNINYKVNVVFLNILFFALNILCLYNNETNSDFNSDIVKREGSNSFLLNQPSENLVRNKRFNIFGKRINTWNLPIYFSIDYGINTKVIVKALRLIELETCIRFKLENKNIVPKPAIYFKSTNYYKSDLGRQVNKNFQKIDVPLEGLNIGYVLREIFHTLGLEYEDKRFDRNKYIYLIKKNLRLFNIKYFSINSKYAINGDFPPYDYGSIMHHDPYHSSKKMLKQLLMPINQLYAYTMGQTSQPSFLDYKKLNYLYCSNKCKQKKTNCFNGGYPDPNNCNKCKCINGFAGSLCDHMAPQDRLCGKTLIILDSYSRILTLQGNMSCVIHLRVTLGYTIGIILEYVNIGKDGTRICQPYNSLEIKYYSDKSLTGPRFCHIVKPIIFYSKNNNVLIYYNNQYKYGGFRLKYKKIKNYYLLKN
uniref:Metalloendopeptidase n=1 Tax=Strongyloides stercoralis TaxID=6248 RepID=A0A0K0ERP1_STRER